MAEFTIRGAGIIGLSVAWALVTRGCKVQVIDPHGVGAGASGGIVGALAPHMPEKWGPKKQFQFESLRLAETWWPKIDALSGLSSGYGRIGRYHPILTDRGIDLAHARARGAVQYWMGHATWDVVDRAPAWMPPSPTGLWVYDTLSARINPRAACTSLARALDLHGCPILRDGPDQGTVIWATGVHDLTRISHHFNLFYGAGEKGQGAVLDFDLGTSPQLYVDNIHIIPHANGTTAIGSTTERYFDNDDTTDHLLDDLIARVHRAVPALVQAPILARWAGARPRAHSRAPLLGRHPLDPDAYIANGGFKIGLAMAPKMALSLTEMILDGAQTIPTEFSSTLPTD